MMKKKGIGIFVCLMLLISVFPLAAPAAKKAQDRGSQQPLTTTSQEDVPIWEIGDQWIYQIDDVNVYFNSTAGIIDAHLIMDELPLQVSTLNETTYTLDFETTISGSAQTDMNFGDGPVNVTITFSNLQLSGDMVFEKSTLGIKTLNGAFTGRFWVKINQQPYLPLPWLPTLPVKLAVSNFVSDFSTAVTPLMFPLNESMFWNFTSTNLSLNGEVRSPWFSIILLINTFYPILSEEIAALLPIVNIQEAFATIGIPTPIQIPMIEGAFYCLNTEPVTVPAGTFTAYNITILDGMASCFYAPDAGNIIKLTGNIQQIIPFITNINLELKSTTYS